MSDSNSSEPLAGSSFEERSPEVDLVGARVFGARPLVRLVVILLGLLALTIYTSTLPTVLVVLAIVAMIMIHELGHFIVAKISGMKVTEYFLGFGPRIYSKKFGETEYGIKAIPAGGYVRIIGMNSIDEVPPSDEERTYRKASFPARIATSAAGSFMHFLMAFMILWSIFAFVGVPNANKVIVSQLSVFSNMATPAASAGIKPGDQILKVDNKTVTSWSELASFINSHSGKQITLEVARGGKDIAIKVTPVNAKNVQEDHKAIYTGKKPLGMIGIVLGYGTSTYNPIESIAKAGSGIIAASSQTISALVSHFSPHGISLYASQLVHPSTNPASPGAQSRFESPVGIVRLASQAVHSGLETVLGLLFSINIFIGIFNMIPLLPLDGGHVAVAAYEWARSKKGRRYQVDITKMMPLTYAVFALIIVLGVTALYLDVTHPLGNPFG